MQKSWSANDDDVGTGEDDAAAAAVVGDERRVGGVADLAGRPHAPARRGDRPRVDRLDRGREQLHALEEERPLLGVEEREALVRRDLRHVRLDLREVGVDRRVERVVGVRDPLGVDAAGDVGRAVDERGAGAAAREGLLLGREVRRDDDVVAGGEARQAGERVGAADEAVAAARQRHREDLVAELPRVVAEEHDPPGLRAGPGVAQRGERDADLEHPAVLGDPPRRVPVEVGRGVLVAGGVVGHRVVLDAARGGEEEDAGAAVVAGVEDDAAVVDRLGDVVAVGVRRADLRRVGVEELESGVEVPVVVRDVSDRSHLGGHVVAGTGLDPGVDAGRAAPAGIGEVPVHRDRPGGAGDADLGAAQRLRNGGRPCRGGEHGQSCDEKGGTHPCSYENGSFWFSPQPPRGADGPESAGRARAAAPADGRGGSGRVRSRRGLRTRRSDARRRSRRGRGSCAARGA